MRNRRLSRLVSLLGVTALAASVSALPAFAAPARPVVRAGGPLADLSPATTDATDGAHARLTAVSDGQGHMVVHLAVSGLDPAAVGWTFGTHVHVGPCVAGNGAAAGPHYNRGGPPSPQNEVWLDFTVRAGGVARSRTFVPFAIPAGAARSVVVHAQPTRPDGEAGRRLACLPVAF